MVEKLKTDKKELKDYKEKRQSKLRMDHIQDQIKVINRNLRRVYDIWDGFFKTVGVIVSVIIAGWITWTTRNLYMYNGKWTFGTVFIGGIIYVLVLTLLLWLVWATVNALLVNKCECC